MRAASKAVLFLLSFGVAAYAAVGYSLMPLGSLVHPDMKADFVAHPIAVYSHVFAAMVALLLGPFQFSSRLRRAHIRIHRWTGRVYLAVGVLVGGLSGLYISQFAFGGFVARLGFATLAVCWLYTGLRAFLAIRRGAIDEHRKWMVRNLGSTMCRVLRVDGLTLLVAELDAIDGTPVLDVKPVMREFLPREAVRQPAWSHELMASYWLRKSAP